MQIGLIGINTRSSNLLTREAVAQACALIFQQKDLLSFPIVLLSTCNRTEVYFSGEDLPDIHSEILMLLRSLIAFPFEPYLYSYFGSDCFEHLVQVTAGIDSLILAETEIQRQVKVAYEGASLRHKLSAPLHFLFQKSLKIGKEVRSLYFAEHRLPNLEGTIYQLCQQLNLLGEKSHLLLIGNSEINRRIATHFQQRRSGHIHLCTRTPFAAQEWVEKEREKRGLSLRGEIEVVERSYLERWKEYEIVIAATHIPNVTQNVDLGTSQSPGVERSDLAHMLHHVGYTSEYLICKEKKRESIVTRAIFDLSVPRTVDPKVGADPKLLLFNMEEIGRLVEKKRSLYWKEVCLSKEWIRKAVLRQCGLFREKEQWLVGAV